MVFFQNDLKLFNNVKSKKKKSPVYHSVVHNVCYIAIVITNDNVKYNMHKFIYNN